MELAALPGNATKDSDAGGSQSSVVIAGNEPHPAQRKRRL
jgi:hypothetical protein